MALQLPGMPTIYQADPFAAARKQYEFTKGIANEKRGQDAFGQYADTLYGNQQPQTMPGAPRNLSLSALGAINAAAPQTAPAGMPNDPYGRVIDQDFAALGVTPEYINNVIGAESGGNPNAKNPNSSATGLGQFLDSTWTGLMQSHPELGLTADGRTDLAQSQRALRVFTADNAKQLASSGIPVNPGSLYAAHFLGAGGASNVLTKPDDAPVSAYVSPEVVQANPQLADMTVADFRAWASEKGGGQGGGYRPPGIAGIPQATGPKYTLPPREVMQALFSSPDTRQIAISLAQGAQQGRDASTLQTFERPDGSIWQFNPATGEIGVVQDALTQQVKAAQVAQSGVPSGYRRSANGGLEFAPGGPADPSNPLNADKANPAPTVQTRFNPETGLEEKVQWNPQTKQWDPLGGAKAPSNGLTVTTNPDGTTTVTQGGSVKPLTEGQSKDVVYVTRASGALPTLDKYGDALTNLGSEIAGNTPVFGNFLKSPEYQQAQQAGLEFLQAILRKDTGAAITPAETAEYGKTYLPQPGDSPQVLKQKQGARVRAINAIRLGLPPQAILTLEQNGVQLPQADATQPPPSDDAPAHPMTQADFDALPSGALYIDPEDGNRYRKP